jgi:hypothetical protein
MLQSVSGTLNILLGIVAFIKLQAKIQTPPQDDMQKK